MQRAFPAHTQCFILDTTLEWALQVDSGRDVKYDESTHVSLISR